MPRSIIRPKLFGDLKKMLSRKGFISSKKTVSLVIRVTTIYSDCPKAEPRSYSTSATIP